MDRLLTVEGVVRDGQIELPDDLGPVSDGRVLVTFLQNNDLKLADLGIDKAEAAELRAKFESFTDWNDPAMDAYNDYDNAALYLR